LYTLFAAVDANFKLKGKERGIEDFELDPGWGSYVENECYKAHVQQYVDQPEVMGNFLSDILMTYLFSNRLTLARQTMMRLLVQTRPFRKNGVGDLEKGEK
jgi:hypothetical protein